MQVLFDTGPWVALLDRSERRHEDCRQWFSRFSGTIFATEAVLTEVLYLLNFSPTAQSAALDFVLRGAVTLVPSSHESLARAKRLMEKYRGLPMDYADATLVSLAEETSVQHILTFDNHFNMYRLPSRKSFVLLP